MTKDSCPPTFRPSSGKMLAVLVADASQRSGLRPRGRNLRGFLTHALEQGDQGGGDEIFLEQGFAAFAGFGFVNNFHGYLFFGFTSPYCRFRANLCRAEKFSGFHR